MVDNPDPKTLEQWYREELEKRDREIDELKEKNAVLFKAALRQSEKLEEMKSRLAQAMKKGDPSRESVTKK